MQAVRHVQASDSPKGEQVLDVIRRHGRRTAARRSYLTDVGFTRERIRRMMGGATPPPLAVPPDDLSGVPWFTRA